MNTLASLLKELNKKDCPKETKELLKLCRKVCDRIAKEVV